MNAIKACIETERSLAKKEYEELSGENESRKRMVSSLEKKLNQIRVGTWNFQSNFNTLVFGYLGRKFFNYKKTAQFPWSRSKSWNCSCWKRRIWKIIQWNGTRIDKDGRKTGIWASAISWGTNTNVKKYICAFPLYLDLCVENCHHKFSLLALVYLKWFTSFWSDSVNGLNMYH